MITTTKLPPHKTQELIGLAKIMRLAFNGDDLSNIASQLAKRIEVNSHDSAAMMDLSIVLQINARPELASELQSEALKQHQFYGLETNPDNPALKLLAIMGPGEVMANTPIDFLVEDSDIALSYLYLGEGLPVPSEIPVHDVAFVAVCESDRSQSLLTQLIEIMRHWPMPFINMPSYIAQLSRDKVSEKLASASGIVTSHARRVSRLETINLINAGSDCFPLIARPVNSHAGQGLAKLDDGVQVSEYLNSHDSNEFFIAPFIDYRSDDDLYRKYRVTVIDGVPFAAHMAISQHWMVHYLNADMIHSQKNRDSEEKFIYDFDTDFATKHRVALQEIDRRIGLDYYSIDCANTRDGKLLVFELDSGAVVHSMDPAEFFPYKAPQMKLVFEAFQQMLRRKAIGAQKRMAA